MIGQKHVIKIGKT